MSPLMRNLTCTLCVPAAARHSPIHTGSSNSVVQRCQRRRPLRHARAEGNLQRADGVSAVMSLVLVYSLLRSRGHGEPDRLALTTHADRRGEAALASWSLPRVDSIGAVLAVLRTNTIGEPGLSAGGPNSNLNAKV